MTDTTIVPACESDSAYLVFEGHELAKAPKHTVARHKIVAWSIEDDGYGWTATPIFAGSPAEDCYVGIITPEGDIFDPENNAVYTSLQGFLDATVNAVELTLDDDQ